MKATELLHTQSSVDENNNSNYGNKKETIIERWKFTNAPFTLIKEEPHWYVVMGDYRVSDTYQTSQEALQDFNAEFVYHDDDEYVTSKTNWGVLTNVISVIIEETLNLRGGK